MMMVVSKRHALWVDWQPYWREKLIYEMEAVKWGGRVDKKTENDGEMQNKGDCEKELSPRLRMVLRVCENGIRTRDDINNVAGSRKNLYLTGTSDAAR